MIDKTLPNITPGIITGINLMLSTAMAWETCFKFDLGLQWSLIFVPTYYLTWKLFYGGCNRISERVVNAFDKAHKNFIVRKQQEAVNEALKNIEPEIIIKEPDSEILDCVRYFVRHKDVLKANALKISKKPEVTQASLKNFAWNIAFQYGIDGETTAIFVKATFGEWFSNTEISSIQKTLRNIRGSHAIEIDERILNG